LFLDKNPQAKKQVFADVHFLLFYTAILNALQSLLLHFVSKRMSQRLWVQTESLELSHYVEIREEFENVKHELELLHNRKSNSTTPTGSAAGSAGTSDEDADRAELGSDKHLSTGRNGPNETAEEAFALNQDCISEAFQGLVDRIRYPALKTKYNELLLQIRFHELRVHFLQAYNLPLKLKISDYLLRSEEKVMLKLVHVSPLAWLLLTGAINLGYFVLGIVSYKVQDSTIIGTAMIWIFFCIISLFVLLSWLLKNKMKAVFKTIMNSDTLWDVNNADSEESGKLAAQQRALFPGGDPKLVMAAVQSMQFGYAVALSTLIIYEEEINDASIHPGYYFLAIAICYGIFIVVIAQSIPRYTLCTSLGQLVNERHLHETLAAFHLEEAKLQDMEESEDSDQSRAIENQQTTVALVPSVKSNGRKSGGSIGGDSSLSNSNHGTSSARQNETAAALMFDMVRSTTDTLRSHLPASEMVRLEERQGAKQKNRVKQFSDGVVAMSRMKANIKTRDDFDLTSATTDAGDKVGDLPSLKRDRRARRKAQSEGVALMASRLNDCPDDEFSRTSSRPPPVDVDEVSVGSHASGYSDVDDVPQVDHTLALKDLDHHEAPKITLRERLYDYFIGRRYVVISNIFGTMVAFFFVGQRVESFLHSEGIADDRFTHFDFAHDYIFWVLLVWLCCFAIGDFLIMYTLRSFAILKNNKERQILLSGLLDLVLTGTCLAVFCVAEGERCCNPVNDRFLEDYGKGVDDYGSESAYYEAKPECSCPTFGTRQYGGLGTIEPYVSLIALRVFRFWLAKRIVLYIDSKGGWEKNTNQILRNESLRMDPLDIFGKSERHGGHSHDDHGSHGHGHGEGMSAAELWEDAVANHPEIVAKYGQFSGELLRAMLGLHVECESSHATTQKEHHHLEENESRVVVHDQHKDKMEMSFQPQSVGQSSPVAVVGRFDVHTMMRTSSIRKPSNTDLVRTSSIGPIGTYDSLFASPNARLVRSMRRCDRKFIPFLNKWSVVDVAITRYEMVYFNAVNVDGEAALDAAGDSARQAVMATKGGKGLRLCDVAAGRCIVGHLHFSEIDSVHVERRMPHDGSGTVKECPDTEVEKTEFWKNVSGRSKDTNLKRGDEWCGIKQDRLKIHTVQGHALYLRFYSDLEDAQNHAARLSAEDEVGGYLFKNNAFQWAQTIGRFCGPSQLKQPLPHYGDDTSEELRDFLIVDNGTETQKGHRRVRSDGSDGARHPFVGLLRLKVFEQIEI